MCVMSAGISLAVGALSAVSGLYGQNQKIKQQNYQIRQNMSNALTSEKQAKIEMQDGIEESRRAKLQSILATGDLNSKIAAGNIGLNSMTALNLAETEKMNGEYNSLSLFKTSNGRADSYMNRAQSYYQNAQLTSMNAKTNFNSFLLDSGMKIGKSTLNVLPQDNGFRTLFGG